MRWTPPNRLDRRTAAGRRRRLVVLVVLGLVTLVGAPAAAGDHRATVRLAAAEIGPELEHDFGVVDEGEAVELVVELVNHRDRPLEIGAVRPLCGCMSERSDRSVAPGESGRVTLRLETVGYAGPTREAALVEWVGEAVPVTRVTMSLEVRPLVRVSPRRWLRFRTVQGRPASASLEIEGAAGHELTITGVEASASFLTPKLVADDGRYTLEVALGAEAPAGMLHEAITLHTDLETVPTLTIKVTGVVTPAGETTDSP